MFYSIISAVSVFAVGLIAGAELGSLMYHQILDRLEYPTQLPALQAINKTVGKIMPPVMSATVVLCLLAAAVGGDRTSRLLFLAAALLLVTMILVSVFGLGPIKAAEREADGGTSAAEFAALRRRWIGLHKIRVVLDLAAFAAALGAVWG